MTDVDTGTSDRIRYDVVAPGIARITLARADKHNAQDRKMLYAIDAGFTRAVRDEAIKVIVLAADGVNFSSGHDLTDFGPITDFDTVTLSGSFTEPGGHGWMTVEEEIYLGLCRRWRNIPKPTIAQVQGKVIAGGLMLVWPCDIVVASENATFADPVVAFGLNGHEYFTHVLGTWSSAGARNAVPGPCIDCSRMSPARDGESRGAARRAGGSHVADRLRDRSATGDWLEARENGRQSIGRCAGPSNGT